MKVLVKDFGFKGRGFAKYNDKALFLDRGVIGDTVEVDIVEEKKKYSLGKVKSIIKKSQDREISICPYFKDCGGCDFLEYKYQKQVEWKRQKVKNDMLRIGEIDQAQAIEETIFMEEPYKYRNNIQLKVENGKLGYYSKNSKKLVEIKKCQIAEEEINKAIEILRKWKGLSSVYTIVIRQNYKGQLLIVLVTKNKIQKTNQLISELLELDVCGIFENKNKSNKFRFGKEWEKLYGKDYLEDELCGLKFKLSPVSFFQVNRLQTQKLYQKALDYLDIQKTDTVLDLYCGIGTISLLESLKAKEVIGVEIVDKAIEDARENARLNHIENIRFICGKSEDIIEKLIEEENINPNKIMLDPPRAGLDQKLIDKLLEINPERIVYISCNPSTQARDLKQLKEKYKIEKIQPLDMFCNSIHVETICFMSQIK